MFLTTKGRYAVMAMLEMQKSHTIGKMISLKEVAEKQNLSTHYLEQIFSLLKKANIIKSIKGPGGGYVFEKTTDKIKLIDILQAVGENIKIAKCEIETKKICSHSHDLHCNSHALWVNLSDYLAEYFENTSLQDLTNNNFFYKKQK